MSNYLLFDDFAHLVPLHQLLQDHSLSALWQGIWSASETGPLGRPVSMASFALQIRWFDSTVAGIKWGNLAIHLLSGMVIFLVTDKLLRFIDSLASTKLPAAIVTAIWLCHPLQITNVDYAIQRMNVLSALFVLLAINVYLTMRINDRYSVREWVTIAVLWLLGMYSKENALLLPIYLLVLEMTLLGGFAPVWEKASIRQKTGLLTIALLLLVVSIWYALPGYESRPFSLSQRLMTEARIMVHYLSNIVLPVADSMSFYQDDWPLSTGLLNPPQTLASAVLLIMLLVLALIKRKAWPIFSFGILWFFSGHLLESTIFPLELAFEHRNYLPIYGIVFSLVISFFRFNPEIISPRIKVVILCLIIGILAWQTYQRNLRWSDKPLVRLAHLESKKYSVRAAIEAAETYAGMATSLRKQDPKWLQLMELSEYYWKRAENLSRRDTTPYYGHLLFLSRHFPEKIPILVQKYHQIKKPGILRASETNGLYMIARCVANDTCPALERFVVSELQSEIKAGNAEFLSALAEINAQYYHDLSKAISMMQKLQSMAPRNMEYMLQLARYLHASSRDQMALEILDEAKKMDVFGKKAYSIENLKNSILNNS